MEAYYHIREGVLERYTGREQHAVVPKGVHTIKAGALKGCVSLRKITLPKGLERIGDGAFKGCRNLEEVDIPEGVLLLGSYAFHRCHELKRISLPSTVEALGDCVFLYCDSLQEVHIPGVKRLGKQVFVNDVSLEKLEISPELDGDCICDVFTGCGRVREISFRDGSCWQTDHLLEVMEGNQDVPSLVRRIVSDILSMAELDGRRLVRFVSNLRHVEIPEGVECLARSSFFDMRGIKSVTFPASLREIGSRAFRNCINLERIIFKGTDVEIHGDAFKNCSSLQAVRTWDGAEYTFAGIDGLSAKAVPEMVGQIYRQVLGNFRISHTMLLQYLGEESRVVVPEGITMIGEEAFAGKETIDRVILPESLLEIGAGAFRDCLLLQNISLPQGLRRIGTGAFENCVKLLRMHVPSTVRRIEARTFRHCHMLRELTFSDGLCEIGESAFYGCHAIEAIEFPKSLTSVGRMAFYRCRGLREVCLLEQTEFVGALAFAGSGVQRAQICGSGRAFGTDLFAGCEELTELILEDGVCHIPDKLAFGCSKLIHVRLPGHPLSVGRHPLEGTAFLAQWRKQVRLQQKGEWSASDGIFWDGRDLEGVVYLSSGIHTIAGGAFYGNTNITEMIVPESVTWIGRGAFKGCRGLRRVCLPVDMTHVEAEVFAGCENLLDVVTLKNTAPRWQSVGERAFYRCTGLRSVSLEDAVCIGREALAGCHCLEKSPVHPDLQAGERAFAGTDIPRQMPSGIWMAGTVVVSGEECAGEIRLPEGTRRIAPYAFAGNGAVTKVALPEGVLEIGEGAFFGCGALLEVEFPKSLCRMESRAFEKCGSLVHVQTAAAEVGPGAFAFCTGLREARLSGVRGISKGVFMGCGVLERCVCALAESVEEQGFCGCERLETFSFARIRHVGAYGFCGCDSLKAAVFRSDIVLFPYALKDCGRLKEIHILNGAGSMELREYALAGCTALERVCYGAEAWELTCYGDLFQEEIPGAVRHLFYSALSCFLVEEEERIVGYGGTGHILRIPRGIRRIEAEVFRNVTGIREVEIPESVEYIGARAFHGTAWMERQQEKYTVVTIRHMLLDASRCWGEVVIPAHIRLICGWAFANGLGILSVRFLSAQVRVEAYAFRNCIFLQKIVLPGGAVIWFSGLGDREKALPPLAKQAAIEMLNCFKTDSEGVLLECTGNIPRIQLAHGITEIGEGVFQDGNLLTEVIFPATITKIGKRAFAGCKWLFAVSRAWNLEYIGEQAFSCCNILSRVELSERLRYIGPRAFENCISLETLLLPEGIEEIPDRAFYRCHRLKYIQFPSTLRRIGQEAFAFCRVLNVDACPMPEETVVEDRAFYGAGVDCAEPEENEEEDELEE